MKTLLIILTIALTSFASQVVITEGIYKGKDVRIRGDARQSMNSFEVALIEHPIMLEQIESAVDMARESAINIIDMGEDVMPTDEYIKWCAIYEGYKVHCSVLFTFFEYDEESNNKISDFGNQYKTDQIIAKTMANELIKLADEFTLSGIYHSGKGTTNYIERNDRNGNEYVNITSIKDIEIDKLWQDKLNFLLISYSKYITNKHGNIKRRVINSINKHIGNKYVVKGHKLSEFGMYYTYGNELRYYHKLIDIDGNTVLSSEVKSTNRYRVFTLNYLQHKKEDDKYAVYRDEEVNVSNTSALVTSFRKLNVETATRVNASVLVLIR